MSKNITIYTSTTCKQCVMVKKYLDMKGETYNEVNIEQHPEVRDELSAITGGMMRVPVTVVEKVNGEKNVSIGYNLPTLSSALSQ